MTKYRPEHYSRLRVESVKHHSCWDSSVENEDTIEDGSKKKRDTEAHMTILKSEIKSFVF